jgi:hypothetical protein
MENGDELEAARRRAAIGLQDLFLGYFSLGGSESSGAMEAYLRGEQPFGRVQHDTLAHAINERAVDRGRNHPAPYSEDVRSSDGSAV